MKWNEGIPGAKTEEDGESWTEIYGCGCEGQEEIYIAELKNFAGV